MATDILSHVGLSLELQGELKKFMQKALIKVLDQQPCVRCSLLLPLSSARHGETFQQDSSMPAELQSEALDLIISAIDKNLGNYEVCLGCCSVLCVWFWFCWL